MGTLHQRKTRNLQRDIEPNLLLGQDLAIDHLARTIQVVRTTTTKDRTHTEETVLLRLWFAGSHCK